MRLAFGKSCAQGHKKIGKILQDHVIQLSLGYNIFMCTRFHNITILYNLLTISCNLCTCKVHNHSQAIARKAQCMLTIYCKNHGLTLLSSYEHHMRMILWFQNLGMGSAIAANKLCAQTFSILQTWIVCSQTSPWAIHKQNWYTKIKPRNCCHGCLLEAKALS